MFSKSCEYAIRAVVYLATAGDHKLMPISSISKSLGSPQAYTAKILQLLAAKKIVAYIKGNGGGYYIEKKMLAKIFLSDIIEAIDGDLIYTACGLGLKECSNINPCPLHEHFKKIRTDLRLMCEKTSIKKLADELTFGTSSKK
jgi:Rrf2 family protein